MRVCQNKILNCPDRPLIWKKMKITLGNVITSIKPIVNNFGNISFIQLVFFIKFVPRISTNSN